MITISNKFNQPTFDFYLASSFKSSFFFAINFAGCSCDSIMQKKIPLIESLSFPLAVIPALKFTYNRRRFVASPFWYHLKLTFISHCL